MGMYCGICDKKRQFCECDFSQWNNAFRNYPKEEGIYGTMVNDCADTFYCEQKYHEKELVVPAQGWSYETSLSHWEEDATGDEYITFLQLPVEEAKKFIKEFGVGFNDE